MTGFPSLSFPMQGGPATATASQAGASINQEPLTVVQGSDIPTVTGVLGSVSNLFATVASANNSQVTSQTGGNFVSALPNVTTGPGGAPAATTPATINWTMVALLAGGAILLVIVLRRSKAKPE